MEALALSLGVIPFLTGRTVLAVGLLLTFYAVQGYLHEGELSVSSIALGIGGGVVSAAIQVSVEALKRALRAISDVVREWITLAHQIFVTLIAVAFAARALGLFATTVAERVAIAGFSEDSAKLVLVGVVAWVFVRGRHRLAESFETLPIAELPGVSRTLFLADVAWTAFGVLIAWLFPWVGAALCVTALIATVLGAAMLSRVINGGRGRCVGCGAGLHRAASSCPGCGLEREPSRLGLLGRPLAGAPSDRLLHRLELLAIHRCATCAAPLGRVNAGRCAACGRVVFESAGEVERFVRHLDVRAAAMMPAFFVLGLVPGVGLALALVLYKVAPAGALGGYVRWHEALSTRALRSAGLLALALFQPLPVVGALAVGALIGLMHVWTRRSFLSRPLPVA